MPEWLNYDNIAKVFSSARKGADGKPITDVEVKNKVQVEVSGSSMEHFGKSTSAKPANNSVPVGATFFEIDTKTAYMNDGTAWVVI